jgi:hypothetical protein
MKLFQLVLVAAVVFGQDNGRVVVRTVGQYDQDGKTALYSVYVATKSEDVEDLTISAALPPGTRFLESVHKPLETTYFGVQRDQIFWKVPKLERETLLGPLTFRVLPDGTAEHLPATIQAAAFHQLPAPELVESPAPSGQLTRLADSGSLVIDQRGTLDADGRNAPVQIGLTGVFILVPEGAVSQRVTLTIKRLTVADGNVPKTNPATWWCGLYQLQSEPEVQFTKGISASFPSRRPIVNGLPVSVFRSSDLQSWDQVVGAPVNLAKSAGRPIGFGGGGFGGACISQFGFTTCGFGGAFGFGAFGAFGYVEQDNLKSKVTSGQLTTSAVQALISPPSIIAILIGIRP